jgi:hypothetical protein
LEDGGVWMVDPFVLFLSEAVFVSAQPFLRVQTGLEGDAIYE